MSEALNVMQSAVDERESRLHEVQSRDAQLAERVRSLEADLQTAQDTVAEMTEMIGKLQRSEGAVAEMTEKLQRSKGAVAEMTEKLQVTSDRIDKLEQMLFGGGPERKKNKTPDAKKIAKKRIRKALSDAEKAARRKAARERRQKKLDALRTVERIIPLPDSAPEARSMPPLRSTIYEWQPGELVRIIITRERSVSPDGSIITAPPVDQLVEGGCYGPALYAKICVDKCLNALPLRRMERMFHRLGAPLPASSLCALFHRASELVQPIYDVLRTHVATASHLCGDETPLPVLDEDATRKGWMWVFAADDALLFCYSPSRGKGLPLSVLNQSKGTLTVDGYTAYNCVTGEDLRQRGGCWSHARRGLYDVLSYNRALIQPLLDQIGELFYVEALAKDQGIIGTAEHLALRVEKSQPVMTRLFAALDEYDQTVVDGRASISKAIRYILNQRDPLHLFLSDPKVPIHNNLSERSLRIIALMRKNALFAGHDEAAQRFAQLLSLLATCQLHDVNPERWLADVLMAIDEPGLIAQDLLPWNWKTGRGVHCRPYFDTN